MSRRFAILFAITAACDASAGAVEPPHTLDAFDDPSTWTAVASDQVSASLHETHGIHGGALCLDFDFHGVSGYAAMRRPLHIDYPDNYEFDVDVRGHGPANALQFKLADANEENVWWVDQPNFEFPHDWTAQQFKKRRIAFAWGPLADHALHQSDTIEFTVSAVQGGAGEICFDTLVFKPRPLPPATPPTPVAHASSATREGPAANAVDGNPLTAWRNEPSRGAEQTLTLDLGFEREFGGLVLHWLDDAFAARYDVELSDDAKTWRTVRRVSAGDGGVDALYLPDSEARYVRLALHGPKTAYALAEADIEDISFGASANAFFSELAKSSPRGTYPRAFYDEQTYWTVVGVDGGHESGLLSEDGALEVARGGFSIAPFVVGDDGEVFNWANVAITHALADGYLPIPSVTWRAEKFTLGTTAFASGTRGASDLVATYRVDNTTDAPQALTLALVVQPFQVNPAVQFLNTPGGVSPIHDLAFGSTDVSVDGAARVLPLTPPDVAFASPFDSGLAVEHIGEMSRFAWTTKERVHSNPSVHDESALASGAMLYRVSLPPHAFATFGLAIPLDGATATMRPSPDGNDVASWLEARRIETAARWRESLDRVAIHLPLSAQPLADTLRTALADILMSRDGAALRPGTRAYARSWVRDGAMMSAALLRLGHADAARDYLKWYAPYQFDSGKVPCCVDARGSDPVAENDSNGELIYLADEVYRYTGDTSLLETMWPHVAKAARYMDVLRASERTDANRNDDRRAFYGLMPASISHEGYSAKPMHSYWDDFWALAGYKDAVDIADALGKSDAAAKLVHSRDEFRGDLYASLARTVAGHGIDYLPGCAELGDFDATSTTIALSPAGEQEDLPQALLHATFERYWNEFEQRRDGSRSWKDYTPYEWRTVGTFVRLGWRDRAQQAMDYFMHDRRPTEWNQWAEVVGRDPRESRFVGDMPHGWVASDFIRSMLDIFAYERDVDRSLVLAAGVPSSWLDGDGVAIDKLRTPYGMLSYSLRRSAGGGLRLRITGDNLKLPPGGIVFPWPLEGPTRPVRVNGRAAEWEKRELRIRALPAMVETSAIK